ncbi:hypothetical protein EVG20_g1146, partial [Dentipellis fragilis]
LPHHHRARARPAPRPPDPSVLGHRRLALLEGARPPARLRRRMAEPPERGRREGRGRGEDEPRRAPAGFLHERVERAGARAPTVLNTDRAERVSPALRGLARKPLGESDVRAWVRFWRDDEKCLYVYLVLEYR